jgi:hypothetical protein
MYGVQFECFGELRGRLLRRFFGTAHRRRSGHQPSCPPLRSDFLIDDIDLGQEFDQLRRHLASDTCPMRVVLCYLQGFSRQAKILVMSGCTNCQIMILVESNPQRLSRRAAQVSRCFERNGVMYIQENPFEPTGPSGQSLYIVCPRQFNARLVMQYLSRPTKQQDVSSLDPRRH